MCIGVHRRESRRLLRLFSAAAVKVETRELQRSKKERRMKSRTWMLGNVLSVLAVLCVAISTISATNITLNCSRGGSINSTLTSLTNSGDTRGVTLFVSGTCRENITIFQFDHLTLVASPTATLQDASNGSEAVVRIVSSYDARLIGFTIIGGAQGVNCGNDSFCSVVRSSIQEAAGAGVNFGRAKGVLSQNSIMNNGGPGILAANGSEVLAGLDTIGNNGSDPGDAGIVVTSGSNVTAQSDTITNNINGILALSGSVVRATNVTISGNTYDGVWLEADSTALFDDGNVITGNGLNGVSINDLSFAGFNFSDGSNNVSGNIGQPDVACYAQYSATRGVGTVGGTTNCVEPQHKK